MSLRIEYLAPVIPQNGHNTFSSTLSLSGLLSHASPSSPLPLFEAGCLSHTFSSCFKVAVSHQQIAEVHISSLTLFVSSRSRASFLCSRVFPDFYQCLNVITPAATKAIVLEMHFVYHLSELIHSAQAHAFSRLIALLDSCKEILLRHVKIYNCTLCQLCFFFFLSIPLSWMLLWLS